MNLSPTLVFTFPRHTTPHMIFNFPQHTVRWPLLRLNPLQFLHVNSSWLRGTPTWWQSPLSCLLLSKSFHWQDEKMLPLTTLLTQIPDKLVHRTVWSTDNRHYKRTTEECAGVCRRAVIRGNDRITEAPVFQQHFTKVRQRQGLFLLTDYSSTVLHTITF